MPGYITIITLCYPLMVHLGIYSGHLALALYALCGLLIAPALFQLASRRHINHSAGIALLASLLLLLCSESYGVYIVQAHPIIMFSLMLLLFGSSLAPNETPLINRFAILIRGEVSDEVLDYGRKATIAWSLFFAIMLGTSIYLSLYASLEAWSWFANVVSYLLTGAMFVCEFAVRRHCLKDHVDYSFTEFMRSLAQIDYRRVVKGWRRT